MSFNGWKLLVVAPFALTLLSACGGGKNKNQDAYRSPYTGAWLEEAAANDYLEGMRDGSFCARLQANAPAHGIRANRKPVMHAWLVQPDGRVVNWNSRLIRSNMTTVRGIGRLTPDGYMTPYAATTVNQASTYSSQSWIFRRTSNILLISKPGQPVAKFVPMTNAQLDDYSTQFLACTGQEFEDRTYFSYQTQSQSSVLFDEMYSGPGVPPGAAFGGEEPYGPDAGGPVDPRLNPEGQLPPARRK